MTASAAPRVTLTGPQLEALVYAANGLTSSQIAGRLGCGRDAINLRIRYAASALGATSRTHAVALAIARGLIDPDEIHPARR
ncbi:LuxR C-terminal-related transcriptional regulator [Streptomyces yunnanensis]|uniref:LuxR family transcriptional regulator, transcriptional activator of the bioluminescence operon n=1 Tax=Streptomyces yunnanensis TaxID=156453 RepID=A0A9X8MT54_9ACTN|nr:LuxR C-terminal-related transcriptional regulator [Streptomyces yunnanensis]SHL73941.1 LuxR family transcriptional regulator, transcriptional activator of the bioluminescence operon [Streptomyces yunnanensis]